MKSKLLTLSLIAVSITAMAQKPKTFIKCHFFDGDGSGTFDGRELLNKQGDVTLRLPATQLVNVGDTVVITYFTIPKTWRIDTGEGARSQTCIRCNSPYFEEYKVIVTNKFKR